MYWLDPQLQNTAAETPVTGPSLILLRARAAWQVRLHTSTSILAPLPGYCTGRCLYASSGIAFWIVQNGEQFLFVTAVKGTAPTQAK